MLVATKSFETALHAIREALIRFGLDGTAPIISAVSGGPDSLALCLLMQQIANEDGRQHRAVIINHGLREAAATEANIAAAAVAKFGITSEIVQLCEAKPSGGIQAFARKHRLSLLAAAGRATGAIVCFGHHRQDQAETIYMRLSKASGLSGLAGMPELRVHEGCLFVRPLLSVPPELLSQICVDAGLTAVQDPSNYDRRFERVRARQHLCQDTGLSQNLLQLGNAAGAISAQLDSELVKQLKGHVVFTPPYAASFETGPFLQLPDLLRRRALTLSLQNIGAGEHPPGQDAISALDAAVANGQKTTLAGCIITPESSQIRIVREARHLPEPLRLSDEQAGHIFDRCWHITGVAGLRFAALGAAGYRQLPKESALRGYLAQWPYPARLRFPVLTPLDVEGGAHHFKLMERWAHAPDTMADRFKLRLPLGRTRSKSSWL